MSRRIPSARRAARLVLVTLCLATAAPAVAHSPVARTSPASGAVVAHLPRVVTISFGEPVGRVTSIRVVDRSGVNRAGVARRNPRSALQAIVATSGDRLGRYTVTWRIVAADGHAERGSFAFTVRR